MIYLIVLFLLVIPVIYYDILGNTRFRDKWYYFILVVLILVAGLRWRFAADTVRYMALFYDEFPSLKKLTLRYLIDSGTPPLWILLNSTVKTFGGKFFVVQLIQATIVNTLLMRFFKKHSPYPFACVLLYFIWRYQYFNMTVMKAALAVSILIYANDYFLEKKYTKGFILVLIASGFHQSSILLLITPFLTFLRFNIKGFMVLAFAFFVGAILQSRLGDFFEMMDFSEGVYEKLENYQDGDNFMTQNHNLNYFILRVFPFIVYPVMALIYAKSYWKNSPILKLEPFIMLGLVFQAMQFNIHIFYRFVYIYYPYYIIFIVYFFIKYSKSSIKVTGYSSYASAIIIFLPFIVSILYFDNPITSIRYNPYTSVIEKSIDIEREIRYHEEFLPTYDMNEY